MTDAQQEIANLETRIQAQVQAMLIAILLIERGQHEEAKRTLTESLPLYVSRSLQAGTP